MISALSPEAFIKAFVAQLVLKGCRAIAPRDPHVRVGLKRVQDLLQRQADEAIRRKADSDDIRRWVRTTNQIRLSPTGGVENWERTFRAAQLTFTQIGNPDYELITFAIDNARANSEIDTLTCEQKAFMTQLATEFLGQMN